MTAILLGLIMAADPAPALSATTATIDRGDVKAGAPLRESFRLTNGSDRAIAIAGITTSCGCVRHALSKDKLAPGETADLSIEVNTIAQAAGPWGWTAGVKYTVAGLDTPRSLELRMTGRLIREVSVTPPSLALSTEGETTQTIAIVDRRAIPLSLKAAASTAKFIAATIRAGETPGHYAVDVRIAAEAPAGRHDEVLVLTSTDPVYPELRIPVQLIKRAKAAVRAYPETLDLSTADGKIEVTAIVQLRRPDGKPLTLATAETSAIGLKLKSSTTAGSVAVVRVTLDPVLAGRTGKTEIKVTFTDPAGEVLAVPLTWSAD